MLIFQFGLKILLWSTIIFWVIFYPFCIIWTAPNPEAPKNPKAGLMISLLVAFKFFLIGFLILAVISIFLAYRHELFRFMFPAAS